MKKSYLFFTVIFSVLFSIISCNGITDVYSKNNYNVILTVPGGNSSRVIDDYSIDDIRSKINKCQVNVYPVDEDDEAITDSPIYSDKKAAGSVIKLRVDPGIKYVVGITPYWIVDKNKDSEGYKIHNEELSDIFMVNPDSNTPCKVTVTFQKNDFFDFDGILDQWAYVLTGVGSFAQPVQNYNDLLTAISKAKNSNMPTKIYVGCDSYSTRTIYIECLDTINISDKNIIFAPGNYGNSTHFTCPSGKPIFKIGKNGKLSTKHEIIVSCTDNTAFEVTSNGYLNFTGEILNASPDTPVILATDNAEVRIHTENYYGNTITVAGDTNVSGDGLGSYGKSSINVKNNAKLLLSAGATLRNISVVSTEKASVSIKDSEIMTLQAPAVSVGKETTLRMNNVTFANCIASETNESAEGNYDGIVIIDEVTEGDWNDSKVKPGYFEFSNISCNSCSGDFIVSGADIILGGENNFDSIFMTYYYNITNNMDNCFPRIFLKDDFAPNPAKPDPIKLCFKKSIFNYFDNYKFLINGFNVNGYDRYNVKTGLVEECEIYPEFFLTTEGKNISTLNKEYNLTNIITLSDSITNCRLNNEGIICSKFVSADGGGFNTRNTVENIIIENTNVTPIVVTSNIQYANHFWGSTKGLSEITNSDSGVFPFFKVETSEPVIFDGSTGRIKFIAEGSQDILGQAVFVNIPDSLKEDNQKMDLTLRDVEFSLRDCNPVIMSTPNSTVTLDNCSFDVQSKNQNTTGPETCHIVVYGNDCTVKLTGSYPQMLKIYIAGQNFKLIVGPDLYMTDDVNLSFIFEDSVKVYYPKLSDAYKILGYSGGGRIQFQSNLKQQ